MSLIGKKPYVQKVFAGMSEDALNRLNNIVNDSNYANGSIRLRLPHLDEDLAKYENDGSFGCRYVQMAFDEYNNKVNKGFLITNADGSFGFFEFQDGVEDMQSIEIYKVGTKYTWVNKQENLHATEFRSALDDALDVKSGGGEDRKEVNVITFTDVVLDQNNQATLSITADQWAKMRNTDEECIVIIQYVSTAKVVLSRTKLNSSEVIFTGIHRYADGFEVDTAKFTQSGGVYTYEVESLGGKIKANSYFLFDEEKNEFINVGENIPEDYTGISLYIGDDGIYMGSFSGGEVASEIFINSGGIEISGGSGSFSYSTTGATKVNPIAITGLTHSFNEIDPTLRQIVEDAIAGQHGVACTQAQWNAIKQLLDNSLYLNYNNHSLIKSISNGIDEYKFGDLSGTNFGYSLTIRYSESEVLLFAEYQEI